MSYTERTLQESSKNICNIKVPNYMFFVVAPEFPNFRLYVDYDNLLWESDLN